MSLQRTPLGKGLRDHQQTMGDDDHQLEAAWTEQHTASEMAPILSARFPGIMLKSSSVKCADLRTRYLTFDGVSVMMTLLPGLMLEC
jgi:hypothetical protein